AGGKRPARGKRMPDVSKEELIEAITQRVKAALADEKTPHKPRGFVEGQACNATAGECTGEGFCAKRKDQTMKKMVDLDAVRFSSGLGIERPSHDLARRIDHTMLKPDATREELDKLCDEATRYHFATVCVNSSNIPYVTKKLKGSDTKPIAVVGFPLGAATTN